MNLYTLVSKSGSDWVKENVKVFVVYDYIARLEFTGAALRDRQGEPLEAYLVNRKDGTSYVTDDSLTLRALESAGADLAPEGMLAAEIKNLAGRYHLELTEDRELTAECSDEDFAQKVQELAACMAAVLQLA